MQSLKDRINSIKLAVQAHVIRTKQLLSDCNSETVMVPAADFVSRLTAIEKEGVSLKVQLSALMKEAEKAYEKAASTRKLSFHELRGGKGAKVIRR